MDEIKCVALRSFSLNGEIKSARSRPFSLSRRQFNELEARGLVRAIYVKDHPSPAGGEKSSASPAALVSLQTTASESKRGGRRRKAEASS